MHKKTVAFTASPPPLPNTPPSRDSRDRSVRPARPTGHPRLIRYAGVYCAASSVPTQSSRPTIHQNPPNIHPRSTPRTFTIHTPRIPRCHAPFSPQLPVKPNSTLIDKQIHKGNASAWMAPKFAIHLSRPQGLPNSGVLGARHLSSPGYRRGQIQ